jgi:hypothetical protein
MIFRSIEPQLFSSSSRKRSKKRCSASQKVSITQNSAKRTTGSGAGPRNKHSCSYSRYTSREVPHSVFQKDVKSWFGLHRLIDVALPKLREADPGGLGACPQNNPDTGGWTVAIPKKVLYKYCGVRKGIYSCCLAALRACLMACSMSVRR